MNSQNLAFMDVAVPSHVYGPDEELLNDPTGLNPCPHCDSYQADAPEGIHDVHSARKYPGAKSGDPKWNFSHCFKCGFRPGTNVAVSQRVMTRQFEAFQSWLADQQQKAFEGQSSMHPPANEAEVNALKDQLAQGQAREAELRSRLEGGADSGGS
jgi:hypothetical protein